MSNAGMRDFVRRRREKKKKNGMWSDILM